MMRRTKTLRVAAIAAVLLAATGGALGSAEAYQTFNNHKLTYGVSGQRYWLADSAVSNNNNAIQDGVAKWNATSTPVGYSETQTKSSSRMDFYTRSTTSGQYCALTSLYVDTTQIDPDDRNWWWGKVTIDPYLKEPAYCGSAGHRSAIIAHEQGHVMGLAHAVNSDRLMYGGIASTNVERPINDDINGINFLY